jgi:hypothetical protein
MTLDEGIKSLGKRFIGMNKDVVSVDENTVKNLSRIEVDFKSNVPKFRWSVFGNPINSDEEIQDIRVVKKASNDDIYFLVTINDNIGFSDLITHAQTIVEVNSEMEQKMSLMQQKLHEISILFKDLSYNELKTLKFSYKKKNKKNIVENEQVKDEKIFIPPMIVEQQEEHIEKNFNKQKKIVKDETPETVIPEDL